MLPNEVALRARVARGFTLIELLIVVAIIALLISILLPSLGVARQQSQAVKCLAQLHVFGTGLANYVNEERSVLPGGRLPKIDDCNPCANIEGGRKFRPTFVAMMSHAVGAPPFVDPKSCRTETDMFGEKGDKQNYSFRMYVCPTVATWTDERNGSYGYNYQFLGNSRLLNPSDLTSYKNWPVQVSQIRSPARTIAAGDSMGTAASVPTAARMDYLDDSGDYVRYGNEGFNLDPPRVDPVNGEMANFDSSPKTRTAVDPRHRGRGNVLWLDGAATAEKLEALGYRPAGDGSIPFGDTDQTADNSMWSGTGRNDMWKPGYGV